MFLTCAFTSVGLHRSPCEINSLKPENGDDNTLFDQYLRSPSPTPPPHSASSELSGGTLVDVECMSRGSAEPHTEPTGSLAPEDVAENEAAPRDQEGSVCDRNGLASDCE
jgi:hypothetical protein